MRFTSIRRIVDFVRANVLAWRMVAAVFAISVVVTASLALILVGVEYQRNLGRLEADLDRISGSVRPQLALNLWLVNSEAVRTQMDSLLQTKIVSWARLTETDGASVEVGQTPSSADGTVHRIYAVTYRHPLTGADVKLGELELVNTLTELRSQQVSQIRRILVLLGSGMLTAAMAFLWLYHRLIARHLTQIAEYARRFNYERLTAPLVLSRAQERPDELQTLTDAINTMRVNLQEGEVRRAEAQAAMLREKELAEVTLRSVADAILTTTADGRVTLLNPAAEILLGWQFAEARGRPVSEIKIVPETFPVNDLGDVLELARSGVIPESSLRVTLTNRRLEQFRVELTVSTLHAAADSGGYVIALHDVSAAEALTAKLAYQAMHDELTGLANRRGFMAALVSARDEVREGDVRIVLQLDLDQFKIVNDTCGHQAGDELLRQLAQTLKDALPDDVMVGRLGGDEFAALLKTGDEIEAREIAQNVLASLEQYRFVWSGRPFVVTGSLGLVRMDEFCFEPQEVMSRADIACYTAKEGGRNRYAWYRGEDASSTSRHNELQLLATLRQAAEQDWFQLYFQPIVPAHGQSEPHYEVLLRLFTPDGHLIPPGAFIPAAERYDLMATIDRWMIAHAIAVLEHDDPSVSLSVNLSGKSLNAPMLEFIVRELDQSGIAPQRLCFEITETSAIANINESMAFIESLRMRGCQFALDDFGSGFSSFTYLKSLPVDYLKIDGSLVRDIVDDDVSRQMVIAVNRIAHAMGRKTIAEYVENAAIVAVLQEIGVDYLQGYHIGRPQPAFVHQAQVSATG
ncbi:EAL domain-containing protein [Chitinibacteraceae bacterium HSL-7]